MSNRLDCFAFASAVDLLIPSVYEITVLAMLSVRHLPAGQREIALSRRQALLDFWFQTTAKKAKKIGGIATSGVSVLQIT